MMNDNNDLNDTVMIILISFIIINIAIIKINIILSPYEQRITALYSNNSMPFSAVAT